MDTPHRFFNPMSVDQLRAALQRMESDSDAESDDDVTNVRVVRFTEGQSGTLLGNWVFYDFAEPDMKQIQVSAINGADEKIKETAVREIIKGGNALISYATLRTPTGEQDVAVYRSDPSAQLRDGTAPDSLPKSRQAFLNSLPWSIAKPGLRSFIGLAKDGLHFFEDAGKITAVLVESGADISTDGPGGSKAIDPNWQLGTALLKSTNPDVGCDSRTFFGVVIPPWIRDRFGVQMGDFAVAINGDKSVACQVYDVGAPEKIGEVSVALAWELGIHPVPGDPLTQKNASALGIQFAPGGRLTQRQAEQLAANQGNEVTDLLTLIFPGSGNRKVQSQDETETKTATFLSAFAGGGASAAAISDFAGDGGTTAGTERDGTTQEHYDSLTNAHMKTLQPDFASRVSRWLASCRSQGLNPYIYMGSRSPALQQKLHQDFLAHRGHRAVDPRRSYHCYGRAFDWVNLGKNGLEWNNDTAYKKGTAIAEGDSTLQIRGIGEDDNDHLQDAKFRQFTDLAAVEFGNFPS